jgi:hypothetical protein
MALKIITSGDGVKRWGSQPSIVANPEARYLDEVIAGGTLGVVCDIFVKSQVHVSAGDNPTTLDVRAYFGASVIEMISVGDISGQGSVDWEFEIEGYLVGSNTVQTFYYKVTNALNNGAVVYGRVDWSETATADKNFALSLECQDSGTTSNFSSNDRMSIEQIA